MNEGPRMQSPALWTTETKCLRDVVGAGTGTFENQGGKGGTSVGSPVILLLRGGSR